MLLTLALFCSSSSCCCQYLSCSYCICGGYCIRYCGSGSKLLLLFFLLCFLLFLRVFFNHWMWLVDLGYFFCFSSSGQYFSFLGFCSVSLSWSSSFLSCFFCALLSLGCVGGIVGRVCVFFLFFLLVHFPQSQSSSRVDKNLCDRRTGTGN